VADPSERLCHVDSAGFRIETRLGRGPRSVPGSATATSSIKRIPNRTWRAWSQYSAIDHMAGIGRQPSSSFARPLTAFGPPRRQPGDGGDRAIVAAAAAVEAAFIAALHRHSTSLPPIADEAFRMLVGGVGRRTLVLHQMQKPNVTTSRDIDLAALARLGERKGEMLARYLRTIEVQRGDYNGRILTIRRHDLTAMACIFGCHPDAVPDRLDNLGLRHVP
jgi:hypothetical protein